MIVSSALDNNYEIKYGSDFGEWKFNDYTNCWEVELSNELSEELLRSKRSLVVDYSSGDTTFTRTDKDTDVGDPIRLAEGQYALYKSISDIIFSTVTEELDNTPRIDYISGMANIKVTSTPVSKSKIYDSKNILGDDIRIKITKTSFKDPVAKIVFGGNYNIEEENPEIYYKLSKGLEIDSIEYKKYLRLCIPKESKINDVKFYLLDKDVLDVSGIDTEYHVFINIINVSSMDTHFSINDGDKLLFKCHIEGKGKVIMDIGQNSDFPSTMSLKDLEVPVDITIDQYDGTAGATKPKAYVPMIADDGTTQYLKVKNVGTSDDPDYTVEITKQQN